MNGKGKIQCKKLEERGNKKKEKNERICGKIWGKRKRKDGSWFGEKKNY